MKTITKSDAKARAWKQFSLYIRLKGSEDGRNRCYTCDKVKLIKEMNAGHGIGGRNNSVLFLEDVVKPQCVGCNIWGRGQYQIFTRKLIDELGMENYDAIVASCRIPVQYKTSDYLEIEELYKNKIKEL